MIVGKWRMTGAGKTAELVFATEDSVVFAFSCHGGRSIAAERRGLISTRPTNMTQLSVGTLSRTFAVNPTSEPTLTLRAILHADIDVSNALRTAPAVIQVDVSDGPALLLPPSELTVALARSC